MLYQNSGVIIVLQISSTYLEKIIQNQVSETFPACFSVIPKLSEPIGEKYIEARNLITRFSNVSFDFDGNRTYILLTLERLDGILKGANENASDLPEVDEITLKFPLNLSLFPALAPNKVDQLLIELELGSVLNVLLQNSNKKPPSFTVPIDNLNFGDARMIFGQDPGRIKVLPDGNIAIGLNISPIGSNFPPDFSQFLSNYDESHLGINSVSDWSISIDEQIIAIAVRSIDLSQGQNKLRNTRQFLTKLDHSGISISGSGEFFYDIPLAFDSNWWSFDFEAQASFSVLNPGADTSEAVLDFKVTKVVPNAVILAPGLEAAIQDAALNQLKKRGRDKGRRTVISPAYFGDLNTSIGRLYILGVLSTDGQLIFSGNGTVKDKSRPVIDEWPSALVFTKLCLGERDNTQILYLRTRLDRYPLQVCKVTIEGSDANLFEIKSGRTNAFTLKPGDTEEYKISTSGPINGHHQAELVVRSNVGILRIPLTAWIGSASISGLPDSFLLDGKQIVSGLCGHPNTNEVEHTFFIENSGPGALRICNIEILNSTGGDWWFDRDLWHKGIRVDSVLLPGARRALTVTFRAETLDVFDTATLKITTSERIFTVELEGRVKTNNTPELVELKEFSDAGITSRWSSCIKVDDIDKFMGIWEILGDLFVGTWKDDQPEVCTPLWCKGFMELSFNGLAPRSYFELKVDGKQSAYLTDPSSAPGFIFPMPTDRAVRIEITPSGLLDSKVHLSMSNWQLSMVQTWISDLSTLDVSVASDRIVTLGEKSLQVHLVSNNRDVKTIEERELDWQPTSLSSLDKLLVLSGDRGLEVATITGDTFNTVAQVEMASVSFTLPISKNTNLDLHLRQGRCTYLIGTDTITLLDCTDPTRPRESQQVETCIKPVTGFMTGSKLILAGCEYLEVFQLTQKGKPERLGLLDLPNITSIFGSSEKIFAIDKEGMVHIVGLSKKGLELLGMMQNIEHKFLPRGRVQVLNEMLVSGRMDQRGFNLYTIQRRHYRGN